MTSSGMAKGYGRRMGRILAEAVAALEAEDFGLAIRRSQEAVELGVKGALRAVGIEVPKRHDVGWLLRAHRDRLPPDLAARVDEIVRYSADLAAKRELAFYGDDEQERSLDEIFTRTEAEEALGWARTVAVAVKTLVT